MEAINYAIGGANMTLPADAQLVQGISGNAVYLPAGAGSIPIEGNRNEMTLALWRQWDGVAEADNYRGVFETANIKAYFDQATDLLTVVLAEAKTVTDIKDSQEQAHWCFCFAKNGFLKIYKNAELKAEITAGNYPVDFSEGVKIGGGRTHATFDEFRLYKKVLNNNEINGLYRLVTKGTQVQQLEHIIASTVPKYLGVVQTVPSTRTAVITKGQKLGAVDANPGDWVLSGRTIGGWKVGVCYRWSGAQWLNLEPEYNYVNEYHACLLHLMDIEELKEKTGHFGALFAKVLIAQKAMIDELVSSQAFIKNLVVQKLHIDTINGDEHNDFEAWFDETNGLKIKNRNEEIFKVDTSGNIFAKNAVLQDGFFSGELDTPTLKLLKRTPQSKTIVFSAGENAMNIFKNLGARTNKPASGNFKSGNIIKISIGERIKIGAEWRSWSPYNKSWEYLIYDDDYYYLHITTTIGTFEYGHFKYGKHGMGFKDGNGQPGMRPVGYRNPQYGGIMPEYCGSLAYRELDYNLTFIFTGKSSTFMLLNLPNETPAEAGIVWVDHSGYLRLKL